MSSFEHEAYIPSIEKYQLFECKALSAQYFDYQFILNKLTTKAGMHFKPDCTHIHYWMYSNSSK